MNPFTAALVRAAAEAFSLPGPVVEIGSRLYGVQIGRYDLRASFAGSEFIGCDLSEGPGVDRIEDITRLTFGDGTVGTLLCLHILEHVWDVFAACREIRRVVKPGGAAIVVCPFNLHLHGYPNDYWRMTHDSMRRLMSEFPWLLIGRHGYGSMPRDVFALGFTAGEFPDFDARADRFRSALLREGRESVSLWKRLKMRAGYSLFSRKTFRDFIHRDEVHLERVRPRA